MMNEMTKVFEGNEIRIVEEGKGIRFVGVDVARALGYSNPQKAIRDHCKGVNCSASCVFYKDEHKTEVGRGR